MHTHIYSTTSSTLHSHSVTKHCVVTNTLFHYINNQSRLMILIMHKLNTHHYDTPVNYTDKYIRMYVWLIWYDGMYPPVDMRSCLQAICVFRQCDYAAFPVEPTQMFLKGIGDLSFSLSHSSYVEVCSLLQGLASNAERIYVHHQLSSPLRRVWTGSVWHHKHIPLQVQLCPKCQF